MRTLLLATALTAGLTCSALAGPQPYVGEVETFAFNFCPSGWLPTNGALLSITSYQVLYQLLGTTYGGDGVNTFGLPNTRVVATKTKADLHQCIAYLGVFPSRN